RLRRRQWRGARSCNLGIWRIDLERIDGFDASYTGWGREDSDLLIRLLRCGLRRKDGRFATGVIHLWHPQVERAQLAENDARLHAVLQSEHTRAWRGLSALRETAEIGGGGRPCRRRACGGRGGGGPPPPPPWRECVGGVGRLGMGWSPQLQFHCRGRHPRPPS